MGGGARWRAPQKPPFRDVEADVLLLVAVFEVVVVVAIIRRLLVATVGWFGGSLLLEALGFPFGSNREMRGDE